MSELKACPFCGKLPESQICIIGEDAIWCGNSSCRMNSGSYYTPKEWNTRPLEDALTAERDSWKSLYDTLFDETEKAGEIWIKIGQERDALQRKLDIAVEALKKSYREYSSINATYNHVRAVDYIEQALKQLEGE